MPRSPTNSGQESRCASAQDALARPRPQDEAYEERTIEALKRLYAKQGRTPPSTPKLDNA
jgi:hypothetical protein